VVIRFDGRNARAERWARYHTGNLIEGILDDTRESIRAIIQDGVERGKSPRATALEIVGRLNRATGRRDGGLIGLTSAQTDAVIRARSELDNLDGNYFTRKRRNATFDRTVSKAIREGKRLSQADVDRITGAYKDRLLAYRGEVIARTETLAALQAGKMEAARQLIESGKVRADQVTKVWRSTGDIRTRDTHMALNGQEARLETPFITTGGAQMLHPHDTTLGAPASETISCRCFMEIRVRYL
jgi:hypothetical protein